MKALDEKQFRDYMEFAQSSPKPEGSSCPDFVVPVIAEFGFMNESYITAVTDVLLLGGIQSVIASLWFTGFQMGREFEQRIKEQAELERIAT